MMTQFPKCFVFNLADPFPANFKLSSNLGEGVLRAIHQAVAQLNDKRFTPPLVYLVPFQATLSLNSRAIPLQGSPANHQLVNQRLLHRVKIHSMVNPAKLFPSCFEEFRLHGFQGIPTASAMSLMPGSRSRSLASLLCACLIDRRVFPNVTGDANCLTLLI